MKNLLKKAFVVAVGAATILSMSAVSFAGTPAPANKIFTEAPSVNKTITYANGVTLPGDDVTITFTQIDNAADEPVKVDDIAIDSVTKSATNENFTSGTKVDLQAIIASNFTPDTVKNGLYTYTVTETAPATSVAQGQYGWTKGGETYTLRVYKSTEGLKYTVADKDDNKVDSMDFTNTYTKRGNDQKDKNSLEISKTVPDQTYESESPYTFTIKFTNVDENAAVNKTFYTGKIVKTVNGKEEVVQNNITFNVATKENPNLTTEFQLNNGEKLVFDNVPAGTKYVVTEDGGTNFTATYKVTTDGTEANEVTVTKGEQLSTGEQKLGSEGANIVAVTNNYTPVTITGVVTNSLPYIMLILVAIGGIALFMVGRRKFNR